MKKVLILALLPVITSIITTVSASKLPNEMRDERTDDDIVCTADYKPVCGLIGNHSETFGNKCQFLRVKNKYAVKLHEGECKCPTKKVQQGISCTCTNERNQRLCVRIGEDFYNFCNDCLFLCAKNNYAKIIYEGECKEYDLKQCENKCPLNIQGVCASDHKTYASDCSVDCHRKYLNKKDLYVVHQGSC